MSNIEPTVESIEEYIHFLKSLIGKNVANIQPTVPLDKNTYSQKLQNVGYEYYIKKGDDHYFVSRTLFLNYVFDYSLFSAYQCIENYLKAFIKSKNQTPPQIHSLTKLKSKCTDYASNTNVFINSDEISTIIYKYEPFYTIPRYPVSQTKWLPNASIHPDDIFVLDYFVMKFREMLPLPPNFIDILNGQEANLFLCKKNSPNFYDTFLQGNINFTRKN